MFQHQISKYNSHIKEMSDTNLRKSSRYITQLILLKVLFLLNFINARLKKYKKNYDELTV